MAGFLSVAIVIVSTMCVPSVARGSQKKLPPPPEILIFPFTNSSGSANDSLTASIANSVRVKVNDLGYYRSTGYSVLNPSIQRAMNVDNAISVEELTAPTSTPDRADKIAKLVGTPYYLIGNIDSVTTDADTGTVTVVLDGSFYSTRTGMLIKQGQVSGVEAPASKTYDSTEIQNSAVDMATGKLVAALIGPQYAAPAPSSSISSSGSGASRVGQAILIGLAAILALVIINNHGGHSSGSANAPVNTGGGGISTMPPSPPL
jgi:hypothetical protein